MSNDNGSEKFQAILAYFWILFLVPLFASPNSHFCRFHANQGLLLFLASIALGVVAWIPFVGWIIAWVGSVAILVFSIMGIISAAKGEEKPLPLIGGITILK